MRVILTAALAMGISGCDGLQTDGPIHAPGIQLITSVLVGHLNPDQPALGITLAVAFSPDGRSLAVALRDHRTTHLLIMDAQAPADHVRRFDLPSCAAPLAWSPRGDALLICGTVFRLSDDGECEAATEIDPAVSGFPPAFWLDQDHVIGAAGEVVDDHCKPAEPWALERRWRVSATFPARRWVVMSHSNQQPHSAPQPLASCEYAVFDRDSRMRVGSWNTPYCLSVPTTVAGANALCGSDPVGLHCWTLPEGTEIPIPANSAADTPASGSTLSTRIVVDHKTRGLFAFEQLPRASQRAIVDLQSGRILSSWKPRIQPPTGSNPELWPYHCAISSDGRTLAISGDGALELYRIAPRF